MKKINHLTSYLLLAVLVIAALSSCRKDTNGDIEGGKGAPAISSIRTVSKSKVDSSLTNTYTTYDNTGKPTTVTVPNYNAQISAFDSTTTTGNLGNLYAIRGSNLASTTKIEINGVNVIFNRALSSDEGVIFSVPQNVPTIQPQANKLVLTTLNGTVSYDFTVLPPPPTISTLSNYNFSANSQIILRGIGFSSVSAVKLRATNEVVTIVSKVDTQLVIKMPASTANRSSLVYTYTSGPNTGAQAGSRQEFINIDKAYQVFANNDFQNGWADASWTGPSGRSTATSKSGTASIVATYPAGAWQVEGWANWNTGMAYDPAYKFLTFWVKGGTVDHELVLVGDQMAGGYGQVQNANAYAAQKIKVPAKVWTYFKIPLAAPSSTDVNSLNFWKNGTNAKQLGFFLQGQTGDVNETYYFDEVMFVK